MARYGKKVTIYDVAKRAGVTTATVSRVINGKTNVSDETKQKVVEAIEELNYYPSPLASGLSGSKSNQIGILGPLSIGRFFTDVLHEFFVEWEGREMLLYNTPNAQAKKDTLAQIVGENKLDGLFILSLPILLEEEILLSRGSFPIVLLDNKHAKLDSVYYDNIIGAYHATNHLISLGHRRIVMISTFHAGPLRLRVEEERLEGFKMALKLADIPFDESMVHINNWTREGACRLAKRFLSQKDRPTAVFAISDLQAVGVMDACKELGLIVPDDVSIVGYDNMDYSEFLSMTTVEQPLQALVSVGQRLMRDRTNNPERRPENVVISPNLIVRNSTGPAPR